MSSISSMLAMMSALSGTFINTVLEDSPWGLWDLQDKSPINGGTAKDISGNGRDGIYVGSPSISPPLFYGQEQSIIFSSGQYISLPSLSLGTLQPLTIMAIMNGLVSSPSGEFQILSNDGDNSRLWQFGINNAGKPFFTIINPSVTQTISNKSIVDSNSHMLHVVFDPSQPQQYVVKIYFDGVLSSPTLGSQATITPGAGLPAIHARNASGTNGSSYDLNSGAMAIFMSGLSEERVLAQWNSRNSL